MIQNRNQRDFFYFEMKKIIQTIRVNSLSTKEVTSYGYVVIGSVILSIGYAFFIVPHNIVPGGIFGLSIALNEIFGLSVGLISMFINIPILLVGIKVLGRKEGVKTTLSMFLVSFGIDFVANFTQNLAIVDDILVSSIFGGIMIGIAVALVMNGGATTGGNDILVRLLQKYFRVPFSQLTLIINLIIVLIGVVIFNDFTMAAYCLIAIIATSKTIEYYQNKAVENRTVLVFSTKNKVIQNEIQGSKNIVGKSIKLIHHDSNEKMILVTNDTKKLFRIEEAILKIDPDAHIVILDSNRKLV